MRHGQKLYRVEGTELREALFEHDDGNDYWTLRKVKSEGYLQPLFSVRSWEWKPSKKEAFRSAFARLEEQRVDLEREMTEAASRLLEVDASIDFVKQSLGLKSKAKS